MKRWKIIIAYLVYTFLHFLIASIFFEADTKHYQNVLVQILAALGNAVYWAQVCTLYIGLMILSSGLGAFLTRSNRKLFRLFMGIFLGSILITGLLIIVSYL